MGADVAIIEIDNQGHECHETENNPEACPPGEILGLRKNYNVMTQDINKKDTKTEVPIIICMSIWQNDSINCIICNIVQNGSSENSPNNIKKIDFGQSFDDDIPAVEEEIGEIIGAAI